MAFSAKMVKFYQFVDFSSKSLDLLFKTPFKSPYGPVIELKNSQRTQPLECFTSYSLTFNDKS